MTPTYLIVGATGNTGKGVVETIGPLLKDAGTDYRILATTRDADSETSKRLGALPGIEIVEIDWTLIDGRWLQDHQVQRAFIASHNNPSQFIDESFFFTAALQAKVEYVVRISTTHQTIGPATPVSYARGHWAIETMLETPAFDALKWTSLQPNMFTPMYSGFMLPWIKYFRETGEKKEYNTILDEKHGVALVDSHEVGIAAAHLLAQHDVSPHNKQKYIINGPSNFSGADEVKLVEKFAKTTVENVKFRSIGHVESLFESMGTRPNVAKSTASGMGVHWNGGTSVEQSPTAAPLARLYAPKNRPYEQLEELLSKALGQ